MLSLNQSILYNLLGAVIFSNLFKTLFYYLNKLKSGDSLKNCCAARPMEEIQEMA